MAIPNQVTRAAHTIGGYLGVEHAYFDEAGFELAEDNGTLKLDRPFYLVTGNYYGSSVFRVDGGEVTRIEVGDDYDY